MHTSYAVVVAAAAVTTLDDSATLLKPGHAAMFGTRLGSESKAIRCNALDLMKESRSMCSFQRKIVPAT